MFLNTTLSLYKMIGTLSTVKYQKTEIALFFFENNNVNIQK